MNHSFLKSPFESVAPLRSSNGGGLLGEQGKRIRSGLSRTYGVTRVTEEGEEDFRLPIDEQTRVEARKRETRLMLRRFVEDIVKQCKSSHAELVAARALFNAGIRTHMPVNGPIETLVRACESPNGISYVKDIMLELLSSDMLSTKDLDRLKARWQKGPHSASLGELSVAFLRLRIKEGDPWTPADRQGVLDFSARPDLSVYERMNVLAALARLEDEIGEDSCQTVQGMVGLVGQEADAVNLKMLTPPVIDALIRSKRYEDVLSTIESAVEPTSRFSYYKEIAMDKTVPLVWQKKAFDHLQIKPFKLEFAQLGFYVDLYILMDKFGIQSVPDYAQIRSEIEKVGPRTRPEKCLDIARIYFQTKKEGWMEAIETAKEALRTFPPVVERGNIWEKIMRCEKDCGLDPTSSAREFCAELEDKHVLKRGRMYQERARTIAMLAPAFFAQDFAERYDDLLECLNHPENEGGRETALQRLILVLTEAMTAL